MPYLYTWGCTHVGVQAGCYTKVPVSTAFIRCMDCTAFICSMALVACCAFLCPLRCRAIGKRGGSDPSLYLVQYIRSTLVLPAPELAMWAAMIAASNTSIPLDRVPTLAPVMSVQVSAHTARVPRARPHDLVPLRFPHEGFPMRPGPPL